MTLQNLFRYSSHCVLRGLCNSRNSALACSKSLLCHFILPRCQSLTITFWGIFEFPCPAIFACLQLLPVPSSQIVGKTQKKKAREKLAGRGKRRKKFPPILFLCLHFLNSANLTIGAWNRPLQLSLFVSQLLPTEPWESLLRRQSFYP